MKWVSGKAAPAGVSFEAMGTPICPNCGAPEVGELVHCRFCSQPYSKEVLASAIPCPRCALACRWGQQKCARCQTWIVVSCVFCGALSPHNQSACLACREPFQGAAERKRQREQHAQHQQHVQTVNAYGGVAAPFLGAVAGGVAGAALFGHGHHYGYHPGWSHESHDWVDGTDEGPPMADAWDGGGDDFGGGGDDFGGGDFGGGDSGGDY
jgi:hypothetical protein